MVEAMSERTFRVVYEHDDGGWHVFIPSVKGCRTWGRSLGAARKNIREALSTCVDVLPDADKVAAAAVFEDEIRLPPKARTALAQAREVVAKRAAIEKELRQRTARVAKILTADGLSLRDSGDILGMSQEQVRQILSAAT
jgi:predicted RNase H-like HicB family nuclease